MCVCVCVLDEEIIGPRVNLKREASPLLVLAPFAVMTKNPLITYVSIVPESRAYGKSYFPFL